MDIKLDWHSIAGVVAPIAPKLGAVLGTVIGSAILPGLGSTIGGGIGDIAGRAIAQSFGVEATPEAVGKAIAEDPRASEKLAQLEQTRGDEILAAAQVEVERLKQQTEQARIAAEDRQSARQFSNDLAAVGSPLTRVQMALAITYTLGIFILLAVFLMRPEVKVSEAAILILGVLTGAAKDIIQFFFGSSASSQGKDATFKQIATDAANKPAAASPSTIGNIVERTVQAVKNGSKHR